MRKSYRYGQLKGASKHNPGPVPADAMRPTGGEAGSHGAGPGAPAGSSRAVGSVAVELGLAIAGVDVPEFQDKPVHQRSWID